MTNPVVRRAARRLLYSTEDLQLDNQNRITLSPSLLEYAGIKSNAVLNGVIDRWELWSPEALNNYLREEGTPSYEEALESVGDIMQRTALIVREQREKIARGESED